MVQQKMRQLTEHHNHFLSLYLFLLDCDHEKRPLQLSTMRKIDLNFIMKRETLQRCICKSISFVDKMKDVAQNESM